MNSINKTIAFILAFTFLSGTMLSQSLGTELSKIRNAYLGAKQLSFDVEVYSYSTKSDNTAELMSKGYMRKSNDTYYSNINSYELLIMGEKAMIVDRERKTLDYYEYKMEKSGSPTEFDVNIDSLMTNSDSILIRPSSNGFKHFTCFSKNGYIRQTELYVDPQSNFIKRILYYYVDSNEDIEIEVDRVEILYKNIQTSNVDQQYFNFGRYFKRVGSTLYPVEDYSKYELTYHSS